MQKMDSVFNLLREIKKILSDVEKMLGGNSFVPYYNLEIGLNTKTEEKNRMSPKEPNEHGMLKELILYIADRLATHPKFGATKLNKILFYCDFVSYGKLGKPITGEVYFKLRWGPAPRSLKRVIEEMEKCGDIARTQRETMKGTQDRIAPKRKPDYSKFAPEQISIVERIIELLQDKDAEEVSELSHFFIGWRLARYNENIPYQTVFLNDPKKIIITERNKGVAREIAERHGLTK